MADIVNLRQARKARKRTEGENRAEANRMKHGQTKAEMHDAEAVRKRHDAVLDGARRERGED